MRIPRPTISLLLLLTLWAIPAAASTTQDSANSRIRRVADRTLGDAAIAVADEFSPVVYYNPSLLDRFGPEIAAFVMAHEYGHIHYGHVRVSASGIDAAEADAIMQLYELEADCYAAQLLGAEQPDAILAAISFFEGLGERQVDRDHPTGTARAARLRECMPAGTQTASNTPPERQENEAEPTGSRELGAGAGLVP